MVKRTFIFCGFLFLVFSGLVSSKILTGRRTQNQWQDNVVRAQTYLLRGQKWKAALVGSSLSARMTQSRFGDRVYNLALAGNSPLLGLEIIKRSNKNPGQLLVEINWPETRSDPKFLDALFHPVWQPVRRLIPAFREENRPMSFVTYQFFALKLYWAARSARVTQTTGEVKTAPGQEPAPGPPAAQTGRDGKELAVKPPAPRTLPEEIIAEYRAAPDETEIRNKLKLAADFIDSARKNGTEVILFRMPIHPEVEAAAGYRRRVALIEEMFPPGKIRWMPRPDGEFQFSDGIHMEIQSADRYAQFLLAELAREP